MLNGLVQAVELIVELVFARLRRLVAIAAQTVAYEPRFLLLLAKLVHVQAVIAEVIRFTFGKRERVFEQFLERFGAIVLLFLQKNGHKRGYSKLSLIDNRSTSGSYLGVDDEGGEGLNHLFVAQHPVVHAVDGADLDHT